MDTLIAFDTSNIREVNFKKFFFRGRVFFRLQRTALNLINVFVNKHKFQSSEIILPNTKEYVSVFSFS